MRDLRRNGAWSLAHRSRQYAPRRNWVHFSGRREFFALMPARLAWPRKSPAGRGGSSEMSAKDTQKGALRFPRIRRSLLSRAQSLGAAREATRRMALRGIAAAQRGISTPTTSSSCRTAAIASAKDERSALPVTRSRQTASGPNAPQLSGKLRETVDARLPALARRLRLLWLPCFKLRPQGRLDLGPVVEAAGLDGAMAFHAGPPSPIPTR